MSDSTICLYNLEGNVCQLIWELMVYNILHAAVTSEEYSESLKKTLQIQDILCMYS